MINKILHISDTHGCHHRLYDLPDADILVHSGDFTMNGSEQEVIDFLNWFCDLDYRHKIFICGNHDNCLYEANIDGLDANALFMQLRHRAKRHLFLWYSDVYGGLYYRTSKSKL